MRTRRTVVHVCLLLLMITTTIRPTSAFLGFLSNIPNAVYATQQLIQTSFYGAYAWSLLGVRTKLTDEFFQGVDEVKQCLLPEEIPPPPKSTWVTSLKARLFGAKVEEYIVQRSPRKRWAACFIGTVRSSAAGYLFVSETLTRLFPSNLVPSLGWFGGCPDGKCENGRLGGSLAAARKAISYKSG